MTSLVTVGSVINIARMIETAPAPYINEPAIGYLYVALLSKSAQEKISKLLQAMHAELPDVIWPMPPEALHLTLCEVIQARKPYSEDKETLFKRREQEYLTGAADALSTVSPFTVRIDQIEVSPEAIIVRSRDGTAFNDIRAKLLGHISLPDETKRPPDIIHSSIARYTRSVDIEAVRAVATRQALSFNEPITEFKLLKTLVPPLLQYEEIASFPLKDQHNQ